MKCKDHGEIEKCYIVGGLQTNFKQPMIQDLQNAQWKISFAIIFF